MSTITLYHHGDEGLNVRRDNASYEISGNHILVKTEKEIIDGNTYRTKQSVLEIFNLNDYYMVTES